MHIAAVVLMLCRATVTLCRVVITKRHAARRIKYFDDAKIKLNWWIVFCPSSRVIIKAATWWSMKKR
jgi:hypothetical protein